MTAFGPHRIAAGAFVIAPMCPISPNGKLGQTAPMILWRSVLALALSLSLLLGSVAEVLAQAQMTAETTAILCGDVGAQTVQLDGTGTPQHPGHTCTHCLAALAIAVLPQGVTLAPPARLVATPFRLNSIASPALSEPQSRPARGPPSALA
jgi:hypothetical protein